MNISAELITSRTIKVLLSKEFYDGESSYFRIRTTNGYSQVLEIIEKTKNKKAVEYLLATEPLEIGEEYFISDEHNLTTSINYDSYVKSEEFKNAYYYDGDDLGPVYTKESTTFKVFAPTANQVMLQLDRNGYVVALEMKKEVLGIFQIEVPGDLELASYVYLVRVGGCWKEAIDPYAYSSTANGTRSVVINPHRCLVNSNKNLLPAFKNNVDAIIYELHVRDFSVSETSGMKNKGKFLAFMEKSPQYKNYPTGLDYIKSLGVTHIQLLPIFDFGSVDEYHQFNSYNWGYDPMQYNVPEGSYASDVTNPYSRVIECMEMISAIHKAGMRVNMDVVYNHMFSAEHSAFESLVPHYYFRYGKNGKVSNGSYCGNDFDSLMPMARKYIVDSCKRWVSFYGVDGFRFDLMGIIDHQTMNEVYEECLKLDKNIMIYGEGWNMPSLFPNKEKAAQFNNRKMPHIGHFNDRFRDLIKGDTATEKVDIPGYATNGKVDIEKVKDVILGTSLPVKYGYNYLSPNQVVNYVECHDNHTLWDKICKCVTNETNELMIRRQRFITSMVLLSQGIPFLHAGQEFCRTKKGDHNSYISSDEINKIDYQLMIDNYSTVEYVRSLIAFRKEYPLLRLASAKDIKRLTDISNDGDVIIYKIPNANLTIVFNPTLKDYQLKEEALTKIFDENGPTKVTSNIASSVATTIFTSK